MSDQIFQDQSAIAARWQANINGLRRDLATAKAASNKSAVSSLRSQINKQEEALRRLNTKGCTPT